MNSIFVSVIALALAVAAGFFFGVPHCASQERFVTVQEDETAGFMIVRYQKRLYVLTEIVYSARDGKIEEQP